MKKSLIGIILGTIFISLVLNTKTQINPEHADPYNGIPSKGYNYLRPSDVKIMKMERNRYKFV